MVLKKNDIMWESIPIRFMGVTANLVLSKEGFRTINGSNGIVDVGIKNIVLSKTYQLRRILLDHFDDPHFIINR